MATPLVSGAERLYYALGIASKLASKDREWVYIRDRLSEITGFYEELVEITISTGWKRPTNIDLEVDRLASAVSSGEAENAAKSIVRLDNLFAAILPVYRALARYVSVSRIIASLIEIISGLTFILKASNSILLLFGILLASAGVAAGLLYRLRLSDILLAVGGAASLVALAVTQPEPSLLEAAIAAAVGSFAASPLAYFLSTKVGKLAG